jgi:hypothetical protein
MLNAENCLVCGWCLEKVKSSQMAAGMQLCKALNAAFAESPRNHQQSTAEFVNSAVSWFYSICQDSSFNETLCTAWTASALLRIFAARSKGNLALDKHLEGSTWTKDLPLHRHPLLVCILTISAKFNSRDYSFNVDALSDILDAKLMRSLEMRVLSVLDWRLLLASPHYFLSAHSKEFGLTRQQTALVQELLVHCAETPDICERYFTGSMVVACTVAVITKDTVDDAVDESVKILTLCACVSELAFQRITILQEVCQMFTMNATELKHKILRSGANTSTPITQAHQRRTVPIQNKRRRFCEPFPSQRSQLSDTPFPEKSYLSPLVVVNSRPRAQLRDSS